MTNNLMVFEKEEFGKVRVVSKYDTFWFVAKDVAEFLNYRNAPDMVRNLDADEKGTHIMRTPGGEQSVLIINESGLYSAILRSRKPEAKAFKKWVTSEILPAIRKTGKYLVEPEIQEVSVTDSAKISLMILESAITTLRMSDVSKVSCYKKLSETYNVPFSYLPSMVSRPVQILSATELLKRSDKGISAISFNRKMVEMGFLETQSRPSTSKGVKEFKALTEAGLKYGENLVNPDHPLETRPMYYTETFDDLLELITNDFDI